MLWICRERALVAIGAIIFGGVLLAIVHPPRACTIVLAEDTNLAAVFAATSYPLYVLIDKDGNIAGTQSGSGGEDALRQLLKQAGLQAD